VIETAQALVFDAAVAEIDAAMRTEPPEQYRLAAGGAVEHEFFAEHVDRHRPICREFFGKRDRLPVPAHHRATRRFAAGQSQEIVLFLSQHK
jgi:hypothetical protein